MIQVEHLTKCYGDVTAVDDLSFEIEGGHVYGFLGPNGAGKSTTMNIMTGCLSATKGSVKIDGFDIFEEPAQAKKRIGYLPEQPPLYMNETPAEYLRFVGEAKGLKGKELHSQIDSVIGRTGLDHVRNRRISALSKGYKQRVGIARALTTTPDILLCDEATSALDPQTTEAILKLLKKINREMGVTILLITHQMQVVQMICNKVAVMEKGQVVEAGSVLDVFGKPQAPVTKRFVQTVVNDQIPESIISLVKEQKEHFRVERLKFIGSSVKRPVISDICHVEGIVVNILGATVQELQDNIMCVFILQLLGSEEKILKAEKQIDENGVIRERVEVI